MKSYYRLLVNREQATDCSCIPLGATIQLGVYYSEINNAGPDDTALALKIYNTQTQEYLEEVNDSLSYSVSDISIDSSELVITKPGRYEIQCTVTIDDETEILQTEFTVCQAGEVTHDSCGNYTFNNGYEATALVTVTKPDGTVVKAEEEVTAGSDYEFTLEAPGIYLLNYTVLVGDTTITYSIQINFLCPIEACLTSLITQVLCTTEDDPCCKSCNDDAKKANEALRLELNKLMALYGYYLGLNFYSRIKFLGVFEMSEQQRTELIELNDVIEKIIKLTTKCGTAKCQQTTITTVDCGCS